VRPLRLAMVWLASAVALVAASVIVPGYEVKGFFGALAAALVIAAFNAILPPIVAALPLPFTLATGFILVLLLDALMLMAAADLLPGQMTVDSFGVALLAALVATAVTVVLGVVLGTSDDEAQAIRLARRIARRSSDHQQTNVPGIIYLEIDGLALPVLKRALRDGSAPNMAAWVATGGYRIVEWETDTSSQTGASQAGILLGSNENIPAFRWVDKESGTVIACSAPGDCAEIERRAATGIGLLRNGGSSRGNLLSGEADHIILTVSRMDAEKGRNPGYREFFANGMNVTRTLVLFIAETVREWVAAGQAIRRDVRPRGHRGGLYPLMRAAMTIAVRDLIVHAVITDMMTGRPAVYATFSSYDEVAHHSGMERSDTLEALRRLDERFGRIARARRWAARPYQIVVLSDHGQTQGATFLQRNGYSLAELVDRSMAARRVTGILGGDEQDAMVGNALNEATAKRSPKSKTVGDAEVIVLGSGNLGLVYLMDEKRRLTKEEIEERHPELLGALRGHPHVGFVLVHSATEGAIVLGATGAHHLASGRVEGDDPLAPFPPNAARHLLRTDGFRNAPDVLVNSFYDDQLQEGCAFEELISFHGGMGGPQTQAFLLVPPGLDIPGEPPVGAAAVHALLTGWRGALQPEERAQPEPSDSAASA
jgi:uncharacterized membrane protein YvlD (DUF360 family)